MAIKYRVVVRNLAEGDIVREFDSHEAAVVGLIEAVKEFGNRRSVGFCDSSFPTFTIEEV